MESEKDKILIMGIGNLLMGDEGIGVHIAQMLNNENLPPNISVLDGGTGGFHLLEYFEMHDKVILIDATLDGRKPGSISIIKPKFASDFPPAMSTHDIGLRDLVCSLQLLDKMPDIELIVVSIVSVQQQGIFLSKEVEAVVPDVIRNVHLLLNNSIIMDDYKFVSQKISKQIYSSSRAIQRI